MNLFIRGIHCKILHNVSLSWHRFNNETIEATPVTGGFPSQKSVYSETDPMSKWHHAIGYNVYSQLASGVPYSRLSPAYCSLTSRSNGHVLRRIHDYTIKAGSLYLVNIHTGALCFGSLKLFYELSVESYAYHNETPEWCAWNLGALYFSICM